MIPQGFKNELSKLNDHIAAEKKQLGERFRHAAQAVFKPFFDANPEIQEISFVVSTQIYDDENYSDGFEDFRYGLLDDLVPGDDDLHYFEGGPLDSISAGTRQYAAGNFSEYERRWYDADRRRDLQYGAKARIEAHEALKAKIGDRLDELPLALEELRESIEAIDITFAKIVFGEDVTVSVTRDGIEIEK